MPFAATDKLLTKNQRAHQWLKDRASKEGKAITASEWAAKYLSESSLEQIALEAKELNKAPQFKSAANYSQIKRGVFLYCILDIDEALDLLSKAQEKKISTAQEQKILNHLKQDLVVAFLSPTDEPVVRMNRVLANFAAFLELNVDEYTDKKKAKELYYTIYLSLCIAHHSAQNLPFWARSIAWTAGVDIEQVKDSVSALIKQIEGKIMALDVSEKVEQNPVRIIIPTTEDVSQLASTEAVVEKRVTVEQGTQVTAEDIVVKDERIFVEQRVLPEKQRAIQNYFDKRYLELFTSDASPEARLKALYDLSHQVKASIDDLLPVRIVENDLKKQHAKIAALLKAFNDNDGYILSRQYFSQLKTGHLEAFQLLMSLSSEPARAELLATIDAQKDSRWTKPLYYASWLFSPAIVASRAFISKERQDYLARWTPETLDAKAKKQTIGLAESALASLAKQIEEIEKARQEKTKAISADDDELRKLIDDESDENLQALALENTITQSHEELVSKLRIRTELHLDAKKDIQNALEQRYLFILNGTADEKTKIATLISTMTEISENLEILRKCEDKKETLLAQIDPLEELMEVFNQHSSNKLIGPIANAPLKERLNELELIDRAIDSTSSRLAVFETQQTELFKRANAKDLEALIATNTLDTGVEQRLLKSENPAPAVTVVSGKTAADYFVERYRSLITHEAHDEEQGLAHLATDLRVVDECIQGLLAARVEYDAISKREQQLSSVLVALQSQPTNSLLIKLIEGRAAALNKDAACAQGKMNSFAAALAQGKETVKQALLQENPAGLSNILKINKEVKACIDEFKLLREKVSLLSEINQGTGVLDSYVNEHNTWWVRFTDFLARFISIFKTKVSELIDEARALKENLLTSKEQCEQEIRIRIVTVTQDSSVGSDLLADLPEHHNYPESEAILSSVNVDETKGYLTKVSMFKPKPKVVELPAAGAGLDPNEHFNVGIIPGHC